MRLTFLLLWISTSLFGQEMMLWSSVPVSTEFSPTNIPGLELWLDGADTDGDGTLNEETGAAPATWVDKSGNGYDFTRIGDPQIVDAAENGNDVIAFDGSDGYSRNASGFEFLVEDDYTAFFVLEANDYQSASTVVDRIFTLAGSAFTACYFTSVSANDIRWSAGNFNNQEILDLGWQTDNEYTDGVLSMTMLETNYGSGTASGRGIVKINKSLNTVDWIDNGANNTPNTGSFLNDNFYLGYAEGGSFPFHGEFAEIIFFSRKLTSSEISNVEDYLVNKWFVPTDYIAHYDFNGDADDNVSPASNGTVSGATLTQGRDGINNTAYLFDGVNDYISIPDDSKFDFSAIDELSVSMWVNIQTYGTDPILYKGSTSSNREFYMAEDLRFRTFATNCSTTAATTAVKNEINKWIHVVYTLDADDKQVVYINGVFWDDETRTGGIGNCNSPIYVGAYGGTAINGNVIVDDLKIWDRELSAMEVSSLYNNEISYPSGYVFCNNVITEISNVTSTTGRVWMDRNLGASQVATSSTDANAYGDFFQWGRFAEGHQCRNSSTTSTNATTAVPNAGNSWDGLFITPSSSPYNWLNTLDDNLWQGVSGVNNPCPSGYRIPSEAEWEIERASWSSNNSAGAYASPLKLTLSGSRSYGSGGPISYLGVYGFYWTSSVSGINATNLRIHTNDVIIQNSYRANGFEVRCIKEETPLVQNDLILHLDASDPASYPGTGTTWTDLSPEGNDGILKNGVAFDGTNLVFDGVNDYVNDFNSLISPIGDRTVMVYFSTDQIANRTGLTGTRSSIPNDPDGFVLTINRNTQGNITYFHTGVGEMNITSANYLSANRKYLTTATFNSSNNEGKIYINNLLVPTTSNLGVEEPRSGPFKGVVGDEDNSPTNNLFDGKIEKVLIYDRVLSEGEVKQNYNAMVYPYPPGYTPCEELTEIVDVTSTTGAVWMDRNLGASRVATSSNDAESYGDLYQWGRFADGHQCRNSATTSTNATTSVPFTGGAWDGKFILESSSPFDWLTSQDDNLWQGVNGTNNPCPTGYRVPTDTELEAERLSWSSNNISGAYASPLKWVLSGYRHNSSGAVLNTGSSGSSWSSTISGLDAIRLAYYSNTAMLGNIYRAYGFGVRCIKD